MLPFHAVQGSPYNQGAQLGAVQKAAAHAFLDDGLFRLRRLSDRVLSLADLKDTTARYAHEIERQWAPMADFVAGYAAGAALPPELAWLLQLRREVLGYQRIPRLGECTTFVHQANGHWYGAQTVDLAGHLADQMCVVRYEAPGKPQILMLTHTGLAGFLGLNSAGVGLLINMVVGGGWGAGMPPYAAVRAALEASDVETALDILRGFNYATSRAFTLIGGGSYHNLEICDGRARVRREAFPVRTNHFLFDEHLPAEAVNAFACNDSRKRKATCERLLEAFAWGGPESLFQVLSHHEPKAGSLCVHAPADDHRRDATVAAAVLDPASGRLLARRGNPCLAPTQTFEFARTALDL